MDERLTAVQVSLFQNGKEIVVAEGSGGYLGRLDVGSVQMLIAVHPGAGASFFGFTVDGTKNVKPKKDISEGLDGGKHYELRLTIRAGDGGENYIAYPENNLRLVEHVDADFNATGAIHIWEIAVISQRGRFYLTMQPTHYAECYQTDKGQKTYPEFATKWPQLSEFLVSLLPDSVVPSLADTYVSDDNATLNGLSGNEAVVEWFNEAQGLGCLRHGGGTARVHWSQIQRDDELRAVLRRGERVRFEALVQPGQTSFRPTAFEYEAVGVTIG